MSSHWAGAVPPERQQPHCVIHAPIANVTDVYMLTVTEHFMWFTLHPKNSVSWKSPSHRNVIKVGNILFFWSTSTGILPMTLQSRRKLVVSPSPASRGLSLQDGGNGMRSPIGRWNLRRRGSMVTTGLKVAWLPSCRVSSSSGIGWACGGSGEEKGYWERICQKRGNKGYGV